MFNNGIVIIIALAVGIALILGFLIKGERFEMEQEASGKVISVKRGFSFTYLFFGPFVPLLRGHIAGFFLSLFLTFCSCGIAHFILLFCYNGMYINWLVKHGYVRVYREAEEKTKPEAESGEKANPAAVVWSKFAGRKEEEDKTEPLFRPLRLDGLMPAEARAGEETPGPGTSGAMSAPGLSAPPAQAASRAEVWTEGNITWKMVQTKDKDCKFWLPGSPVILTQAQLFENMDSHEIALRFSVQNLSHETVSAIYVDIHGFNVLKKESVTLKDVNYLDLDLERGKTFSSECIVLADKAVRRSEVIVRHVVFANEEIWDYEEEEVFPVLPAPKTLPYDGDLRAALARELDQKTGNSWRYQYLPGETEYGWTCGCGQFNPEGDERCLACGIRKELIVSLTQEDYLREQEEAYRKMRREQEEAERLEQERIRKEQEQRRREEEERLRREQEERERARQQKVEEWNKRLNGLWELGKEKTQEAGAAAQVYLEKGKEKAALYGTKAREGLQNYLHEKEEDSMPEETVNAKNQTIPGPEKAADAKTRTGLREAAQMKETTDDTENRETVYCSQCGCANEADDMFCMQCGSRIR